MIRDVTIKINKDNGDVQWCKLDRWIISCDTYGENDYSLFNAEVIPPRYCNTYDTFYEAVTAARELT